MNDEELIDAVFEKLFPEKANKFSYKRKIRLILEQVYQEMPGLEELRQQETKALGLEFWNNEIDERWNEE